MMFLEALMTSTVYHLGDARSNAEDKALCLVDGKWMERPRAKAILRLRRPQSLKEQKIEFKSRRGKVKNPTFDPKPRDKNESAATRRFPRTGKSDGGSNYFAGLANL
jgi:hypothetical protein